MNAESRLQHCALLSQIILIYYSVLLVVFSIVDFLHNNQNMSLVLIFGSISLLTVSVFLLSQKYIERAYAMRHCYLSLGKILNKVENAEARQDVSKLSLINDEYMDILNGLENHSNYDFLYFRFSRKNDEKSGLSRFTLFDYIKFIWARIWRALLIIFLFLVPSVIYWAVSKYYVSGR